MYWHFLKIYIQCDYLKKKGDKKMKKESQIIKYLGERIKSVEQCYQNLIEPYYDEKLNVINTSSMTKKEKEEFINKRNCLMVQKYCYEEILKFIKGE